MLRQQEQQRVAVGPEARISFLFAKCRPTQARCSTAGAGTVVWRRRCHSCRYRWLLLVLLCIGK